MSTQKRPRKSKLELREIDGAGPSYVKYFETDSDVIKNEATDPLQSSFDDAKRNKIEANIDSVKIKTEIEIPIEPDMNDIENFIKSEPEMSYRDNDIDIDNDNENLVIDEKPLFIEEGSLRSINDIVIKKEVDDTDINIDIKEERDFDGPSTSSVFVASKKFAHRFSFEEDVDIKLEPDVEMMHLADKIRDEPPTLDQFIAETSEVSLNGSDPEIIAEYANAKIYSCSKCEFVGLHKQYRQHEQNCAKLNPKRKYAKTSPLKSYKAKWQSSLKYNCRSCDHKSDDLRDYLLHLTDHGYTKNQCPCCKETIPTMSQLVYHVLAHIKKDFRRKYSVQENNHETLKSFLCTVCHCTLSTEEFFDHWQLHFDKKKESVRVAVIKASTSNGQSLAPDMALNLDVIQKVISHLLTPFNILMKSSLSKDCMVCERVFSRHNDSKRHLIEHLTVDAYAKKPITKNLACQICGADFKKVDAYKFHMRDHANMPLYQCDICNKSFSDSSNFSKHKKVHNFAVLICDLCKRKFTCKAMLEAHMEVHKHNDPMPCPHCNRVYYFQSSLKKHLKAAHRELDPVETRFKCQMCPKRFYTIKTKWDHEWCAHNERKKEIDCKQCGAGFRTVHAMKAHAKAMH